MMQPSKPEGLPSCFTPKLTLIVVADDPADRLAIQRVFPHSEFFFASTVDEAETLARAAHASDFYIF